MIDIGRHSGPANSPWRNVEVCKRVRELWKDHSATQIAEKLWKELRVSVTRNSIVGYLHRQKVTIDQKSEVHPSTNNNRGARPRVRPPTPVNVQRINQVRRPKEPRPEPFVVTCVEVESRNLSLADLRDGDCRYPSGDDPATMTFCGNPSLSGRSWCAKHYRVVTVPTPRRQSAPFIARGRAA